MSEKYTETAQHLKREQEPAPRERLNELYHLICDTMKAEAVRLNEDTWSIYLAGEVHHAVQSYLAAQPPQELVSLRELVVQWRKQDDTKDGLCRNIDLCCHGVCADELESALTRGAVGG